MSGKFTCSKKKQTSKPKTVKTKQKEDGLIDRVQGIQWLARTTKLLSIVNIRSKKKKLQYVLLQLYLVNHTMLSSDNKATEYC